MMRSLWVDFGNDADWAKVEDHDIDTLYYALNDPRVTKNYLQAVASRGYGVGVYVVTNWDGFNQPAGVDFASAVADKVAPLRVSNVFPRVQLDAEQHDPEFIRGMLQQWRKRYPYQATSWTLEPFQGGWVANVASDVLTARVRVVPQAYKGNMDPVAQDWVLRDLMRVGYPEHIVTLFYDAADPRFDTTPDGFGFTQGRLR